MQTVGYHVAVSVDGFIAGPGGSLEGFLMTGDHVKDYLRVLHEVGTVIMGRRTYQLALDAGVADPYPHLETVVFSRSLREQPHAHVTVVGSDLCAYVARLRAREGKGICLVGGGQVAAQLLAAGLVDEVVLKVNPLVLGGGVPVFEGDLSRTRLDHRSTKVFANGVVVSSYGVLAADR